MRKRKNDVRRGRSVGLGGNFFEWLGWVYVEPRGGIKELYSVNKMSVHDVVVKRGNCV